VFTHGKNALDMVLMVRFGSDWRKVLRWGTLGGWSVCDRWDEGEGGCEDGTGALGAAEAYGGDNGVPFGAVRRGFM
jgi:hypothetical protein